MTTTNASAWRESGKMTNKAPRASRARWSHAATLGALAAVAVAALPASALAVETTTTLDATAAATSSLSGYGTSTSSSVSLSLETTKTHPKAKVLPTTEEAKPVTTVTATPEPTKSTLPFTGLNLTWVVVAGLLLLGAGLSIRLALRARAHR